MIILLEILVVAVAVWLVAAPLLKEETAPRYALEMDDAEREKESIFTTLGEIEFDYRMQKLEEDDYESLRRKYRSKAVSILKEEENEQLQGMDDSLNDAKLEEEIAKEIEKEIEKEIQALKEQKGQD